MKEKRLKTTVPGVETRQDMESLVGEIASLTIQYDGYTAAMDEEIKRIRDSYQGRITEISEQLDALLPVALRWAEGHRAEFGDKKSIDMMHGVVGFRTGTFKCKAEKGYTWEKILAHLLNAGLGYTRTKVDVDKEAIIADRAELAKSGKLDRMHIQVVQEESFYVEPRREQLAETRLSA
jgi:phage host-nuclease inhibitor protein Gam